MAVLHTLRNALLTSTLNTPLLICPTGKRMELEQIWTSVSSSSGTISLSISDISANLTTRIFNGAAITKDDPLIVQGLRLEAGDALLGGFAGGAVDAETTIIHSIYDA